MSQPSPSSDIRRDLVALLPRLRRFALTLTDSTQEADQLARDAAYRAIEKSHHWKGEGRIEGWLFGMMHSIWSEEARKRHRVEPRETEPASREGRKPSGIPLSLPDGLASAFLLGDVEGFTYAEAAAILGIKNDEYASRLCAARFHFAATGSATTERRA